MIWVRVAADLGFIYKRFMVFCVIINFVQDRFECGLIGALGFGSGVGLIWDKFVFGFGFTWGLFWIDLGWTWVRFHFLWFVGAV